MVGPENINIDALVNPRTPDQFVLAMRTPGTFLNKEFLNLRQTNVAIEDMMCELIIINEQRTLIERNREEAALLQLLEAREAKASQSGQFAVHPEHYEDKSSFEKEAALETLTEALAKLETAKNNFTKTIADETSHLQKIDESWTGRQNKEAADYMRELRQSDNELIKKMDHPKVEEAFKVASPAKLLKVNPELINSGEPKMMNTVNDIMRQLRVMSVISSIEKKDEEMDQIIKPSDIKRLMKLAPAIPKHSDEDEKQMVQALDAAKKCRHAEIGLKIVKAEMQVLQKEHNHLKDLIQADHAAKPRLSG